MKKSEGEDNKKLVVILSALVSLIVILVVAIVVVSVTNTHRSTEIDYEEYEQKVALATEDCATLKSLYSSGAAPKEVAEEAYDKKMSEAGDDNTYKISLTFCYVQHIRYHGATFDEVLARLKAIEPYLSTDGDRINYYNQLFVYYYEENDWDNAAYYADLRDELMQVEWPDEDDDGETYENDENYYYDGEYEEYEQEEE